MFERFEKQDLQAALDSLRNGKVILYPTDTIWGLGCDALNPDAIDRIYTLKGRDRNKSMLILLENENQLLSYVKEVPEVAYQLIEYSERPMTIVYAGAKNLPENLLAADGSIGIRIVRDPFCQELIRRFRRPIVSTSANLSGELSPEHFDEISEQLKEEVDYIVNYGQQRREKRAPSIIMKLDASGKFEFLRK